MEAAQKALQGYNINGAIVKVAPFGLDHINDSYLVQTNESQYLLQRINRQIFNPSEWIEANFQLLPSRDSKLFVGHDQSINHAFHVEVEGGFWRISDFIKHAYTPQTANSLKEVEEVSKAFGRLTAFLNNFSPEQFMETIPRFHDLSWRLEMLAGAIESNKVNRLETATVLIEKSENFRWISDQMKDLKQRGIPTRVCHNDTKLNNCLLSKSDQNFDHIIDLDTLGLGLALYDYGDLMRTIISPTPENELEIDNLPFGGLYMTYIMEVRFLTDYLNGDIYYKTSFENENLIRARNQFALLELMHRL